MYADPPTHTRLRKLIAAGFTPRMIGRLDDQVRLRTTEILDAVAARDGDVDFVRDVAYQLPMHVIADIVGIPEADRAVRLRPHRHVHARRRSALRG